MDFNTSYLNKSPNKHDRGVTDFMPLGVVWHETAGFGSLEWNLQPSVQASFNYLITRDGTVYHYIDEQAYVAWHGGVQSAWVLGNTRYAGYQINKYFIGVELEGPNDGTPITDAQTRSAVDLIQYFSATYHIPKSPRWQPEHAEIAPGYKTDGQGFDADQLITLAVTTTPAPRNTVVFGVGQQLCTLEQFARSLKRHLVDWNDTEIERAYRVCEVWNIDAAFCLALWHHEGNFGTTALQQLSKGPFNLQSVADDWRQATVKYNQRRWKAYETTLIGWCSGILDHFKNEYAWKRGLRSVETVIPVFAPSSDGNTPDQYINDVLVDMAYIAAH